MVEKLTWAGFACEQPLGVQQVVASFTDDDGVIGQVLVLVPGHHRAGIQRCDRVECMQPCLDSAVGALQEVLVHAVVGDIAGHHQSDGRHMQHGGVVGVGVADLDGQQALALQLESLGRDALVDNGTRGDLAGEVNVPHLGAALGGLFVHLRDGAFGRVRDNSGETLQQQVGAEPVIAVPVRRVDVGQLLTGALDPVADALYLIAGERRVDQYGVVVAEDERGGDR